MPSPTDPRRARSRGKLLDAAVTLLSSGGAAAVTVEAVTRASGVARTTLYRNFPSTDALIAAAFRRLLPTPGPPPADGTVRDQLVALSTEMTRVIQAAPLRGVLLHRAAAPGPDGGRGLGRARPGRPRSRGGAARRTRGARPADRTAPAHRRGHRDPGRRFPSRSPGQPRGGAGVTGAV